MDAAAQLSKVEQFAAQLQQFIQHNNGNASKVAPQPSNLTSQILGGNGYNVQALFQQMQEPQSSHQVNANAATSLRLLQ